jgi:hypothetical protein
MKTPKDYMKILARKGEVTILEHVGGKTIVAIRASGNVATLKGAAGADQLLAELCQICKNWPDMPAPRAAGVSRNSR